MIVGPALAARFRQRGLREGVDFIEDQQLPLFEEPLRPEVRVHELWPPDDEDEDDDEDDEEAHDDSFTRAYFADVQRRIELVNARGIETVIAREQFL